MVGILGNKIGMTQIFTENGNANPVTIIKIEPCTILQIKSVSTHGYNAIQLAYQRHKVQKLNTIAIKYLKEYEVIENHEFKVGQKISITNFNEGQFVDITGTSIGKGFTGNQKRHNFTRGPMTHGSKNHREPGSIGQGSTPGRVFPGKKMSGRSGGKQKTVSNLKILKVDIKENLLIVQGSVAGKYGSLLSIKPTKRV